jgi:hypothetical protein
MIEYEVFLLLAALIVSIFILVALLISIKKRTDILTTSITLATGIIVMAGCLIVLSYPVDTYYEDGEIVTNLKSISYVESTDDYLVEAEDGIYKVDDCLTSNETFISLNCKTISENILGMKIYKVSDICFYDNSSEDMSESMKYSVLDRVVKD